MNLSISTLVRSFVSTRTALAACLAGSLGFSVGCQPDVFHPIPTEKEAVGEGDASADVATAPGEAVTGEEQDIVGGKRDYGHPAVVALVVGGNKLCTGTLIGPRTVLTAHHCVAPTVDVIVCPPDRPQVGPNVEPADIAVVQGNDVGTGKIVARGTAIDAPGGDAICESDLAVLTLDQPVLGTRPLRVADASAALRVGDEVTAVGFGRTSNEGSAGKKRVRRDVVVEAVGAEEIVVGEGTCHGDSGGPLLDASGRILGVLSRGGPGCEGAVENTYTRASSHSHLIAAALAAGEQNVE